MTARVTRSAAIVDEAIRRGDVIYGVNTGYGDSCDVSVPPDLIDELPIHLTRGYHRCGTGQILNDQQTRAVMAVRLSGLVHGWSGVSVELVRLLSDMLRRDILPRIPSEGSVGASGDLTPLSYIAGALAGERDVLYRGKRMGSAAAFAEAGLKAITLRPKEGLAVMNGTAVMTGLAVIAYVRAENLSRLTARLTAMAAIGLLGIPAFRCKARGAKPHPGQGRVAARIAADMALFAKLHAPSRLQDRYSIRCAPHVVGVLEDMLPTLEDVDRDRDQQRQRQSAVRSRRRRRAAWRALLWRPHRVRDGCPKNLVANVADLLDRQVGALWPHAFQQWLAAESFRRDGCSRERINHGLKAVQIAASAWTAEALKNTMPASVFSRSTECHNQDKVVHGHDRGARCAAGAGADRAGGGGGIDSGIAGIVPRRLREGHLTAEIIGPRVWEFIAQTEKCARSSSRIRRSTSNIGFLAVVRRPLFDAARSGQA